jgi:hypothetical protein
MNASDSVTHKAEGNAGKKKGRVVVVDRVIDF